MTTSTNVSHGKKLTLKGISVNPEAYVHDWFERVGYGQQVTSRFETIGFGGIQ
jgi:hypothetical protein